MQPDHSLDDDLAQALYTSLREEIVKSAETQFQIIVLVILSLGTVIGVSVQGNNTIIALAYPVLAAALALAWAAEEREVRLKGAFLAHRFETAMDERFRWDHFIRQQRWRQGWFYWGVRIIFVVAEVGALLVGNFILAQPVQKGSNTPHYAILQDLFSGTPITSLVTADSALYYGLFFAGLASILATIIVLWHFSEYEELFDSVPARRGFIRRLLHHRRKSSGS